ncbi:fibronectin type III domain-containing protein [Actinokineospora sp.]|uniref:fibronectin type III domain-containing protein n=1 Tax=Actinokineospora sp. TaxID=1872133 RepID=UPI004037A255
MTGAQLTTLFDNYGDTSGRWSGADSTASVPLPDGRIAWLFSDSFIGTVNPDGSRPTSSAFINNSIVVQDGSALVSTVHGGSPSVPQSLVAAGPDEMYWVADGTVEAGSLKVLYNKYRKVGTGSLDVVLAGTALVTIALPALTVTSKVDLPLGTDIAWGAGILEDGGYTYLYGSEDRPGQVRFAHLARVPAGGLAGAWQFWNGTGWSAAVADSARLPLSGVGTAFGVQKIGGQYVVLTVDGSLLFNPAVVAYTAASPTGPFTGPIDLFVAPEPAQGRAQIVYDARFHPELAPSGKILVSYNVNSLEDGAVYQDAGIYRPRFVDIAWPRPTPDPATVPAAPTGVAVGVDRGTGVATVSWTPPPGTGLTYDVWHRDVTEGATHFVKAVRDTATTATQVGMLDTGHTYEFKVSAANAVGEGPISSAVSVLVTIDRPAAPTGIAAVSTPDGRVTLTWNPVHAAWRYDVYRKDVTAGDPEFSRITDGDPGDTTFVAEWLEHQHAYEFVVTATHGGGESPISAVATATASYAPAPTPTGLTATALTDGQIRLTWADAGTNLWYQIYQRDLSIGETAWTKLPIPIVTCCEMVAGYLLHAHRYEFAVAAINRAGESPRSVTAQATSAYPLPGPPSALTASAGDGAVTLNWTASPTAGAWYWVYQRNVTAGETGFTRLPYPLTTCCTMAPGYLANNHEYEFKITAVAPGGESAFTNTVRATPRLPLPAQITGLTATAQSDGGVRLSWSDPGEPVYFWIYQRDVTAGETGFTRLSLPTSTCCSFTAGYLAHNHVYQFKVAAENSTGLGALSVVAQATARYSPPPAPGGMRAISAGDGTIDLDWNAAGPNLYYWVYVRDVTAGQGFTRSVYPTLNTSATMGPFVHGHVYEFKVTGENAGGEGPASSVAQVTSIGGLPLPPSGLNASAGNGQVTLSWSASPTPNVYYWVEYRAAGGSWQRLQYPVTTCCSNTVGYLLNGTTYEFRVRATNVSGDSGATNVASARPLPPLPGAPSGLSATPADGRVTLRWTASPSPDVYYWIEYRPAGGSWTRLKYPLSTCCTHTVTYLLNGTTYDFRVRATNLAGDSGASNTATARPMPPIPQAPATLTAVGGHKQVTLSWGASGTPNVYYWVEYRALGGTWVRLPYPVASCCTHTVSYLPNGVWFEFRVFATNLAGDSGPSPAVSARPMPPAPQPPTYLSASPDGLFSVRLSWGASPTPDVSYWIYYRMAGDSGAWQRSAYPVSGTSIRLTGGLFNGELNEFKVTAENISGVSTATSPDEAVPERRMGGFGYRFGNWANGSNLLVAGWPSGRCEDSDHQRICYDTTSNLTGQPMTVGDYLLWSQSEGAFDARITCEAYKRANVRRERGRSYADSYGPALLLHEGRHSTQWSWHSSVPAYMAAYGAMSLASLKVYGNAWQGNAYEMQANLHWGGYLKYSTSRYFNDYDGRCNWLY